MTQKIMINEILQNVRSKIQEITSSFEVDAKLIAAIGKDKPNPAGNIADRLQTQSSIPNFQIQDSVLVEAKEICNAGDGPNNKEKRANRVKELASVMGLKIMNRLYPFIIESDDNFELGGEFEMDLPLEDEEEDEEEPGETDTTFEGNTFEDNDLGTNDVSQHEDSTVDSNSEDRTDLSSSINLSSLLAKLATKVKDKNLEQLELFVRPIDDNYLLCLRNSIELEKDRILVIIQKKAGNEETKSADNIQNHASDIARMIVRLSEITSAIVYASNSAMISTGIIQVTIEYILIEKASDIARCVQSENAEEVAILINTPFYNTSTAQQTIAKAMFGVVISQIIKDNLDEIAGTKYLNQSTVAETVETVVIRRGIMQGYKRRMYLLMALANSIAHNIVIRLINSNILNWNLFQVFSHAVKTIIEEKAEDIVGYGSHITAATIQSSFQKTIKEHITDKVNQIFYNLNKSLVIDMQQQPTTNSHKHYQLKLVNNRGQDSPSQAGSDSNIILSIDSGCKVDYGYKCVKHTINLGSSTKATEICGLRLYFGESEVNTYDTDERNEKSVFYQQSKNYVHVYFYSRTFNTPELSGTNTSLLDKAPLLFEYNSQYYKPIDRDNYLNKWIYVNTITSGDVVESRHIEQRTLELNNLNKYLNRVDLDQTATCCDTTHAVDTDPSNTYRKCYGIPYPGKYPSKTGLEKSFYDRICVKACVTDKYRRQVHTTINKYQIGDVCFYGHKITRINNTQPQHNQVEVYYDPSDHHFSRPLLILLTNQGEENGEKLPITKKWYKRVNLNGKYWAPLGRGETIMFESPDYETFKDKLQKIASELYTTLGVELNEKNTYKKEVTVRTYNTHQSNIEVSDNCSGTAHKAEGYQCCEHNLSSYYTAIKRASHNQQLTFVLDPQISGIKLGIFTADNTVAPVLTYTNTDSGNKKSLVVYFWKGEGDSGDNTQDQDPVTLMFNYKDKFFGPKDKDNYFTQWRQYEVDNIGASTTAQKIKAALNKITRLLNHINLENTDKDYGHIKPPGGLTDQLKSNPRVTAKKYIDNTSYNSVTHSTEKTGCIGNVKYGTQELTVIGERGTSDRKTMLEDMEQELERSPTAIYNALISYYHHSDKTCRKPLLIKISGGFGTTTLFYERDKFESDINWKKVTGTLRDDNMTDKVNQIFYNLNKSVKIELVTKASLGTSYLLKLIKNDNTGGHDHVADGKIEVGNDKKCSVDPAYKCIKHSIELTSPKIPETGGLRFYFGDHEVQTFKDSSARTTVPVHYDNRKKEVHVYFHTTNSKVPLLIRYNSQCFRPMDKTNYFDKWVYDSSISDIAGHPQPSDLNKISQMLNEINLAKTGDGGSGQQYGLDTPSDVGDTGMKDFDGNRITATRTSGGKFRKVVHTTIDKLGIGPVRFGDSEVKDNASPGKNLSVAVRTDTSLSSTTVNQVTAYYHTSDTTYIAPLMLGFASTNGGDTDEIGTAPPTVFYKRVDSTTTSKWKKIDDQDYLTPLKRGDQDQAANKINTIHYTIGKSVVIRVDHQTGQGSSDTSQYPVQLIENKAAGSVTTNGTGQITVSSDCSDKPQPTGYTCYTHEIPTLTSSSSSEDTGSTNHYISGLKFYICTNHYLTTDLSVYYDSNHNHVKVYFYGTMESTNPPVDNVPLLVEYNGTHYKPSSRDGYFDKWVQTEIPSGNGRTDLGSLSQIGNVLDEINKDLNTIELNKTGDGDKYGIKAPSQLTAICGTGSGTPFKEFCNRVTVTRDNGGDNYLKVTHKTVNKGPIGDFYMGKNKIEGIKTEPDTKNCNKVDVYYRSSDIRCHNPLLVCITTQDQNPEGSSTCKKWFLRSGVDVTKWNEADEGDDRFETPAKIKAELEKIYAIMANYLLLQIQQQGKTYQIVATRLNETPKREHKADISIDTISLGGLYKADQYRIFQHKLKDYYDANKSCIKQQLGLQDQGGDPTLLLRIRLVNKYLHLLGKDGINLLTPPLTYGNEDAVNTNKDPYVYFIGPTGPSTTDTTHKVPLLLKIVDKYFRPMDKTNYFDKWVYDSSISDIAGHPQPSDLNKISQMLNEINLAKTGDGGSGQQYGLDTPSDVGDTGMKDFDGNRITATRTSGGKFRKVVHTTIDKLGIGPVRFGDSEVKDNASPGKNLSVAVRTDTSLSSTTVNQVTAYYHTSDTTYIAPLMLGFASTNGGVEGGATTPVVFYERVDSNKPPVKWSKVQGTGLEELKKGTQDKIADKLNQIRYQIGKSVVINLTNQADGGGCCDGYSVQVVDNKGSSAVLKPASVTQKITVTKGEKCTGTDSQTVLKGYACYIHQIPPLTSVTESQYIGGLKFYVCANQYLPTFGTDGNLPEPIYYDSGQQTVTVYFYSNGHGPPTEGADKVPLLVQYGTRYYKPINRKGYFYKWVLTEVSTEVQGENALSTVIDGINKDLNAVQLDKTGSSDRNPSGYGFYPNGGSFCFCGDIDNFCNRVSAKRDTKSSTHYLKVTHATTNKAGIGSIYSGGQVITSIKTTETDTNCNMVSVYYASDDNDCKNPLLVCLCQQATDTAATTTTCKKWFKRNGIDITSWVEDKEAGTNYGTDESIKSQLDQIVNLFKDNLYLELDSTSPYQANVQHQTGETKSVQQVASAMAAGPGGSGSTENRKPPTYTGDETFDGIIHTIVKAAEENPPLVYGSGSAVAGVGLVGTVGAVVYKKCVVASAVAASLAS